MDDHYSNSDKLMAVVSLWLKPMMAQLPPQLALLSPLAMPIIKNVISMIPDGAIPQAAKAVVDNSVRHGGVQIWNIRLTQQDMEGLQKLLSLNLPCEDEKPYGYDVIIE